MGKNNLNPAKPDLETPRIPSIHYDLRNQRIAPHCEICDELTLTTFNLSDGMGAGDPCCPSCWADKKHGINHTLDCGCILTDLTNGEKYITPCDTHQMTTKLKIVLTKDGDA